VKAAILLLFDPQGYLSDFKTPFAHFGTIDQAVVID
jgi:hypothetical protein